MCLYYNNVYFHLVYHKNKYFQQRIYTGLLTHSRQLKRIQYFKWTSRKPLSIVDQLVTSVLLPNTFVFIYIVIPNTFKASYTLKEKSNMNVTELIPL